MRGHIRIEKKEEGKRRTIIATFLNYKQREKVLDKYKDLILWEDQIEYTVEKRQVLIKPAKEIRERGKFAKVAYNRLVSY